MWLIGRLLQTLYEPFIRNLRGFVYPIIRPVSKHHIARDREDCDAGDFSNHDVVYGMYRVLRAVPVCPLERALSSLDELPQASSPVVREEEDRQTVSIQTPPLARSIADHRITAEHDFS
jgi:hypothetical protein